MFWMPKQLLKIWLRWRVDRRQCCYAGNHHHQNINLPLPLHLHRRQHALSLRVLCWGNYACGSSESCLGSGNQHAEKRYTEHVVKLRENIKTLGLVFQSSLVTKVKKGPMKDMGVKVGDRLLKVSETTIPEDIITKDLMQILVETARVVDQLAQTTRNEEYRVFTFLREKGTDDLAREKAAKLARDKAEAERLSKLYEISVIHANNDTEKLFADMSQMILPLGTRVRVRSQTQTFRELNNKWGRIVHIDESEQQYLVQMRRWAGHKYNSLIGQQADRQVIENSRTCSDISDILAGDIVLLRGKFAKVNEVRSVGVFIDSNRYDWNEIRKFAAPVFQEVITANERKKRNRPTHDLLLVKFKDVRV